MPIGNAESAQAGDSYATFGFPLAKPTEGLPGNVDITGWTTEGGCPVLAVRSNEVSLGFSGAPAWDRALGAAIGMVASLIPADFDPAGRQTEVSFVVPAATLVEVCPPLRVATERPYRGLDVFEEEHASDYFGREVASATLVDKLRSHNFVAVVGVSGSGKSSLIRAGLKKGLNEPPETWLASAPRYRFRPGTRPALDLVLAINENWMTEAVLLGGSLGLSAAAIASEQSRQDTADELERRSPSDLALTIAERMRAEGALVVGDQFERLFTHCASDKARQHFIELLLALADGDVKVLIALRADFYGKALEHGELARAIERGQLTLMPMTRRELLSTIEKPARNANVWIQPGLAANLADDVTGRPGDLPLLEFALTQLWDRDAAGRILTAATYETIGRLQGALADYAEGIWRRLATDAERAAARRVFLTLVSGRAAENEPTLVLDASRRAWQQVELDDSIGVIEKLVDARLLTAGRDSASGQPTIELAHEALLRAWPRLQNWVRQEQNYIRWYDRDLVAYLRRWTESEENPDFLLPAALLDEARRWVDERPEMLSGPPTAYIRASLRAREEERERTEHELREKSRLLQRAEQQANIAQSRYLAARAHDFLEDHFDVALLLSVAACRMHLTYEARQGLRSALLQRSELACFLPHATSKVIALGVSRDAQRAAAVDADGTVRMWDLASRRAVGTPIATIRHAGEAALDPDLETVAVVGPGRGYCGVWSLRTGSQIGHVIELEQERPHPGPEYSGINVIGRFVGLTRIYDVCDPGRDPTETGRARLAASAAAEGGAVVVAIQREPTEMIVFDPATGGVTVRELETGPLDSWVVSPNGRLVAGTNDDLTYTVLNVNGGVVADRKRVSNDYDDLNDAICSLAISPAGHVALGMADGSVVFIDREIATPIRVSAHPSGVRALAISPSGDTLISGAHGDDTVILWNRPPVPWPRLARPLTGSREPVSSLAFCAEDRSLVAMEKEAVTVWDVESGNALDHREIPSAMALSSNGSTIVSRDGDQALAVWDVASGSRRATLSVSSHLCALSPDGGRLALQVDERLMVWDVAYKAPQLESVGSRGPATFGGPEGHWLAASSDQGVSVYDTRTGKQLCQSVAGHAKLLALSPDGEHLAAVDRDDSLLLWNLGEGSSVPIRLGAIDVRERRVHGTGRHFRSPVLRLSCLAFSPDGQTLAVGGPTSVVALWDVVTRRPLGDGVTGHPGWRPSDRWKTWLTSSIAFAAEGGMLAVGGGALVHYRAVARRDRENDNAILLWDIDVESWQRQACKIANRDLTQQEWDELVGSEWPRD